MSERTQKIIVLIQTIYGRPLKVWVRRNYEAMREVIVKFPSITYNTNTHKHLCKNLKDGAIHKYSCGTDQELLIQEHRLKKGE